MATEKKIFKDIVYIGQKILEAITRHNDDAEAHPTISKQIKDLSSPYVIPEGTDLPIKDRKKGKIYFKVTSRQSGGGTNETIKVSPTMGLKIQ